MPLFKLEMASGPIFVQISTPGASQHLHICNKCISSGVMNRLGQKTKVQCFLNSMPLDTRAEFEFPTVHHAMPCGILLQFVSPLFIGPIGPDLCAFPQQSFLSSVMFSSFSLARSPCATWRGAVAMSNMSRKHCDRMGFIWDICPFIRKSKKRRQRCRRRCSKTCL